MTDPGNKVTIEDGSWKVTIEHLDIWNGNAEGLYELVKTAFLAQLPGSKEYFDECDE